MRRSCALLLGLVSSLAFAGQAGLVTGPAVVPNGLVHIPDGVKGVKGTVIQATARYLHMDSPVDVVVNIGKGQGVKPGMVLTYYYKKKPIEISRKLEAAN